MRLHLLVMALLSAALISAAAQAGDRIPTPTIPKAEGKAVPGGPEGCVEPVEVMRKDHMEFILHQRDETVHKGIRTTKYSFTECINCHVVRDDNQMPVNHKSEKHFCNSCHTYASVQIDCFECHSSTPATNVPQPLRSPSTAHLRLFNDEVENSSAGK